MVIGVLVPCRINWRNSNEKNENLFEIYFFVFFFVSIYRRYEEDPENAWHCGSWFEYLLIVILSTILLVGVLVLTLFWVIFYRGGFAWSENPELQFNLHPVLMVAGFITFSGFCKYFVMLLFVVVIVKFYFQQFFCIVCVAV